MAGFSQSSISRLESGGNLAFDVRVLRIFQRLLGIPPRLLGLSDNTAPLLAGDGQRLLGPVGVDEITLHGRTADGLFVPVAVDRHTLLAACMSSVLGAETIDLSSAVGENNPIDPDVVRRLRVVRRLLNESKMWLGPANLAPAVHQIYTLSDRMRRSATGRLRRELLDVAGVYAEFSGWLRQAVGDIQGAVEWTERALQQAHAADNGNLVAYVYFRMGQLAEVQGDTDRVIGLARAAQRERDLSPEVRAIALHQEASGHAVAGDVNACLKKLEEASAMTRDAHRQRTDEYQVGSFCDQRYSDLCRAGCLLELGSLRDAVAIYEDEQLGRGMDCGWEQLQMAKLARAYAASGEPEHAAALGFQALAMSRNHRSALVFGELRRLDKWSDVPAIAALADALSAAEPRDT